MDRRHIDFVWLQSRTEWLRTYSAMLVPGLPQTREYAETLIRNVATADTPEEGGLHRGRPPRRVRLPHRLTPAGGKVPLERIFA
ncbi:MAG: Scr1 family TA system antitoxin-like transcriptional regulator [Pseudonocardiaceae bacterium]